MSACRINCSRSASSLSNDAVLCTSYTSTHASLRQREVGGRRHAGRGARSARAPQAAARAQEVDHSRAAVKGLAQRLEALLPRRVPNLQRHELRGGGGPRIAERWPALPLSQQQRSAAAAQFVAAPRRPQRRPWCKNLRRWSPCTCSRTGSARSETCTRADGGEAAVMRRGGPEDTRAASGRAWAGRGRRRGARTSKRSCRRRSRQGSLPSATL